MKTTKTTTKQRAVSHKYDINDDLRGEFTDVLDDGFLDEEAFSQLEDDDE